MRKLQGAVEMGARVYCGEEPVLGPGVRGALFDGPEGVVVGLVIADNEGSGEVAAWLDSLPKDRRITFLEVLNGKLEQMLLRRGYVPITLYCEIGPYDALRREPMECPSEEAKDEQGQAS